MKRTPCFLVFAAALFFIAGCGRKSAGEAAAPAYNPHVEAFTSGRISRTSPVYLVLSEEVGSEKTDPSHLRKYIKIKPAVEGEFLFEDARTVVFKPASGFERNASYTVTVDLSGFFDITDRKDREFVFGFSTLPLVLRADFRSLDVNAADGAAYDVEFSLRSPDSEAPETIESLIEFSEPVANVEWTHAGNGKNHTVKLVGIKGGENSRNLVASVGNNKLKVEEHELLTVNIPDRDRFAVYDVRYVGSPEKYVEATFTKNLDEGQGMRGLAYIENNSNETVSIEGNKLRLYPDAGKTGDVSVYLTSGIRNSEGKTLSRNVLKTIEISSEVPSVRFIGEGVVIPQSEQLTVPFQAVYLKGVVVRVIRIPESNVGQFLQTNNLDENGALMRVGRLVARKTIWLDEEGGDLSSWQTYALDLRQMIEPEQGAIYRIELSFDRELSAYPCEGIEQKSREQIAAEDDIKFREEESRYDDSDNYYYYDYYDYDWNNYRYSDRNDPCTYSFYTDTKIARNVLATDLGLMAKMGENNEIIALVHNIGTTRAEKGVDVEIFNFQNQVVGTGKTDENGHARITYKGGRPYYMKASIGKQRSYLRLDGGSALSTSSFDTSGEVVQKGIKGFIYGDRGVWRPGDTLYLSFMLGDRGKNLPADLPVVMELYNPMGQLSQRKTRTNGEFGLYAFEMPTDADAPTGAWNVQVHVGGVTFSKRVRVESVKPNRLKIDLQFSKPTLLAGEPVDARMHVEWLQGATARNLGYEMEGTFTSAVTAFEKFKGFVFDDPSKSFESRDSRIASGTVDENGDTEIRSSVDIGSAAPGMLAANIVTRVYEESGDFSLDGMRIKYSPYRTYVGVKSPQQDKTQLNTGAQHKFEVAAVDYLGNPLANRQLNVTVYKVYWYWWWSSSDGNLANYMSDSDRDVQQRLTVTTGMDGRGSFSLSFGDSQWGTYFIQVSDPEGQHSTGIMSYFDWPDSYRRGSEGSDAATRLAFKTDKDTYAPGETIKATIPSAEGSRAIVSIENGSRVISLQEFECTKDETTVKIEATAEMQPNVYVNITLLQPHGLTQNDLPIRLYGVVPVTVTSDKSRLTPVIAVPDEIKPEQKYEVMVSEKGGREMAYTLAIVDEGLLDLTRFQTPDPWKVFNAREALGVSTWDMYNYIVGAYGGRIEQLFSIGGDDEAGSGPKAIVNRFKPVVQFDGPFVLKKGEKKKHTYTMPNYNGRVRVMVVATDGEAYGNADKSVLVRKPVMVLGTLPRVIGVGEEMVVPATVFATQKGVGNVGVTIECSDNMEIVGPASQTLSFSDITDKQASFRIRVKSKPGAGKVTITATGKGEKSVYETDIEIRSVRRKQVKVIPVTIGAGQSWKQNVAMPGADGTNMVTLEVSDVPPVNLAARLDFLIGYPHGCIEQITSRSFPQLYIKQFAQLTAQQEKTADEAVKETLRRYKSYQTAEGGFAYWPGNTSTNAWGTVYATHFILEAESKGYLVPAEVKRNAIANMRLVARNWRRVSGYYSSSEELTQAYRLYVLALGQSQELGAMNRLREEGNLSSSARWMLSAAYAQIGRKDVAKTIVAATTEMGDASYNYEYDLTYGSPLRDRAVKLIALCMMDNSAEAAAITKEISEELSSDNWYSTQSTAYALMGLSRYMAKYKVAQAMSVAYVFDGKQGKAETDKNIWSQLLSENASAKSAAMEINNPGKATVFARVITEGVPDQGEEEAYGNGVAIDVSYRDSRGNALDVASLRQGTNLTAVVTVRNPTSKTMRNLVLTQIFPAGWEILNTRYMNEGATDTGTRGISYQDIRDDRVYTYIDNLPSGQQVTVRLDLAAVYAGRFYLPPVYCEAMYDNLTRANTRGLNVEVGQ